MIVGPVFTREAVTAPRRPRFYVQRCVYGIALLLLACTAWMVVSGTQWIRNIGDLAAFGNLLFRVLAPLQMALLMFLAAIQSASAIAIEKDRKTLILLLMTRLANHELVVGKLLASLLNILVMLVTSLPIFMLIVAFGGTSFAQVGWTFAVTAVTALATGSLGTTIGLWREKTFQALALVLLLTVFWIGTWEAIGLAGQPILGIPAAQWAAMMSPIEAIRTAVGTAADRHWQTQLLPYLLVMTGIAVGVAGIGIWKVRQWNPSRDIRPGQAEGMLAASEAAAGEAPRGASAALPGGHVDDRRRRVDTRSRQVGANPVYWRETKTWAYGKKILLIRLAYWLMAACVAYGLYWTIGQDPAALLRSSAEDLSPTARLLGAFLLLSLVIVNALAVTSITSERDGKCLDLLMVTDLSPREFLLGKLGGVLTISLDLVLVPLLLFGYLWYARGISLENWLYLTLGWLLLNVFAGMLGIHCGMMYWSSRRAIGTSLGTVFFLFLGVATTMVLLVNFAGNMEAQLPPFLAFIVGGSIGLYAAIGERNPSTAMVLAAAVLPVAMFYSVTSLLLGRYLSVFLVMASAYGFATLAMMVPALGEYNIAMGRSKVTEDE